MSVEVRHLIRCISLENPLWGAPRIHGELLKLGYDICKSTIAKYMVRRPGPPSQTWQTFIRNHMAEIVAIDFLTVHTAAFKTLYVFVVLSLDKRCIVQIDVTGSNAKLHSRSRPDWAGVVGLVCPVAASMDF